jgi:hypothetical protein
MANDLGERLRRAGELVAAPERPFERLLERRDRRRRRERLLAGGVGMAVAVAAIGGAVFAVGRAEAPSPGLSAEAKARDPRLILDPGEFSYVRTVRTSETGQAVVETWWGPDGSGRVRSSSTDPNYGVPGEGSWGSGDFPIESDLSGLSTDPSVLVQQIRERSAPGGASPQPDVTPGDGQSQESGSLWRAIDRLLELPNSTPELRSAIYEVAAGVPGVEETTGASDPVGRDALMLEFVSEGERQDLFFDPQTLQLMAATDVALSGEHGAVHEIVVEAGIVDSTEATPDADERFFPLPASELPGVQTPSG